MICDNKHCWRCMRFKKKWKGWAHIGNGVMIKIKDIKLGKNIIATGGSGSGTHDQKP